MTLLSRSAFATLPVLTAAALLAAPSVDAQPVINDSFVDGLPTNSGLPLESAFFTTSSGSGLGSVATPGFLDFASGSSGRAIHTVFAPQTLTNIGDSLTASFVFTTPTSVGTDENNGFRIGLFNQGGMDLGQDISSSSSSPNALLQGPIAGFSADYDVNGVDDEVRIRQADPAAATGRLLTTTGGFNSIGSADPATGSNGFAPTRDYAATLAVTRTSATEITVSSSLTNTANGDGNTITTVATADAFDFSFLGLAVTSDAFGSSNTQGDPDNGLDFSNVSVTFVPVPEPGSLALLGTGAGLLLARRRASGKA